MSVVATFFLIHESGHQKYVFDVPGQYVVGRDENCTLTIPPSFDESVSREHCQIIITDNGVYIRDTGSSNGTFVNDQQLQDGSDFSASPNIEGTDIQISSGDKVKVGNSIFQVEVETDKVEAAATPAVSEQPPVVSAPQTQAEVAAQPEAVQQSEVAPAPAVSEPPPVVSAPPPQPAPAVAIEQTQSNGFPPRISSNMPIEQEKPIVVNGWTILPPKKKKKPLIRINI